MEKDDIVLMAARASRIENQDAIDFAIVSMLPDPKEVENPPLIHFYNLCLFRWSLDVFITQVEKKLNTQSAGIYTIHKMVAYNFKCIVYFLSDLLVV